MKNLVRLVAILAAFIFASAVGITSAHAGEQADGGYYGDASWADIDTSLPMVVPGAAYNWANIKSSMDSDYTLWVCKNWKVEKTGTDPHCVTVPPIPHDWLGNSSGIGGLIRGHNAATDWGFYDYDGIVNITQGRCLYNWRGDLVFRGNNDDTRNDFKVSGSDEATYTYRYDPCV